MTAALISSGLCPNFHTDSAGHEYSSEALAREAEGFRQAEARDPKSLTLDQLCSHVGIKAGSVLGFVDEVDQSDEEAVRVAIRAGIAGSSFRDLRSYADLFAGAIAEERIEAVIQGMAMSGCAVLSKHYGRGTVLSSYRNSGSLGGWVYRVRFNAPHGSRAVAAESVEWIGGLPVPAMALAAE